MGDDPKVNQINDTAKVARFPLATNEVYFDKEGVKRYSWEINGDNFVFIDGKREEVKEEE